jgi:S1-C subfamily serine protease
MNTKSLRLAAMLLAAAAVFAATAACGLFSLAPASTPMTPVSSPATAAASVLPATSADEETRSSIDLEQRLVQVYKKANPSVVYILTTTGSGSGFVFDDQGHIVTNNHVIAGSIVYEVVFASGERRRGSLVGSDPDSDLAVIKVNQLPEDVIPLPLAADQVEVGQFVVAIGNPFGEQGSMSMGIISGLGRSLVSQRNVAGSNYSLPQVIQTDAPINPGNSGGPLLNLDGEVVGINSAIATTTGSNSGVGFSIPVGAVARIAPSLIESGAYLYPYMGVAFGTEIDLASMERWGLPQSWGAYVVGVTPGSPAEAAGLVAANLQNRRGGDLIIAIDGIQVRNFSDLNSYLVFQTVVGQTIEITVMRGNREITIPLTLASRP